MTKRNFIVNELKKVDFSMLDDVSLFTIFCETHDDNCTGCQFANEYCPSSSDKNYIYQHASIWMGSEYDGGCDD